MYYTSKDDDDDFARIVKIPKSKKPRAKELNEALLAAGGGKMKSPKTKPPRFEKRELMQLLYEDQE